MTLKGFAAIWSRVLGDPAEVETLPERESIPGVPEELKQELLDK